ncbi:MAG: hypothetical protein HY922_12505 [Elusimicrobia bacterium]|nr:hypothetical protein [Elusimicrobiota bacterium]
MSDPKKGAKAAAALCLALAVAGAWALFLRRPPARSPIPPREVKHYGPLTLLEAFLPAGLEEGDAARDYVEAAEAVTSGGDAAVSAFVLSGKADEAKYAGSIARVEAGARKKACFLAGALAAPADPERMLDATRAATVVALLAGVFNERAQSHMKEGKLDAAQAELGKALNVGRHLAQDWNTGAQFMGAALVTSSAMRLGRCHQLRGDQDANLRLADALKQLRAALPAPEEIQAILDSSMDTARLPALSRFFSEERLRRPYAVIVLQAAAALWSPDEIAAAIPVESRRRLIESAAASPDPRLADAGRAYLDVLGSVGKRLAALTHEKRRDVVAGLWLKLNRLAESPVR